jgi:hypothetical protein
MESFLPLAWRKAIYDELGFENPLEFDSGDVGPCCGGVQVTNGPQSLASTEALPLCHT